ncbi:hypothetical protein ACVINZ_001097 [Mesorhizobium jarvisii]
MSLTPGGGGDQQARRQVDLLLGKTVEMEAVDAGNMFTEIVAAFAAGAAKAAGARAVDRHQLSGQQAGHAGTDRLDLAGGFGADDQRQLALGEGHAAPAPDVDMVQRHRLDAQRDFAECGWRGRRQVHRLKTAVLDKLQCAHKACRFCSSGSGSLRPVPAP